MSLDQIIKQRRSIRKYKKKPVSNEQIQLLIQAAVEAPSWKNSQTARYHVITSQPLLNEFKERCLPEFNQENCKDAPVLIVTSFIPNRSGFERDGTPSNELANGWGCYDLGLHNQNILLKATELGLGSVWVCFFKPDVIKKEFQLPDNLEPINILAIGYGKGIAEDSERHSETRIPMEELVSYDYL